MLNAMVRESLRIVKGKSSEEKHLHAARNSFLVLYLALERPHGIARPDIHRDNLAIPIDDDRTEIRETSRLAATAW